MRSIISLAVVVIMTSGIFGCAKCSPKALMEKKPITVEAIGSALAPAICEKYSSCNQSPEFNKEQCLKDIGTGITENLKQTADLKVDQDKLDGCLKAITASPCEALNSATPPVGCEFLQ